MGARFEKLDTIKKMLDEITAPASVMKFLKHPNFGWASKKENEYKELIAHVFDSVTDYEKKVGHEAVKEELERFKESIDSGYTHESISSHFKSTPEKFDECFWDYFQPTYIVRLETTINVYLNPTHFATEIYSSQIKMEDFRQLKHANWTIINTYLNQWSNSDNLFSGKKVNWTDKRKKQSLQRFLECIENYIIPPPNLPGFWYNTFGPLYFTISGKSFENFHNNSHELNTATYEKIKAQLKEMNDQLQLGCRDLNKLFPIA